MPEGLSTLAGSGAAGQADGVGSTASFDVLIDVAVSPDGQFLFVLEQGASGRPNAIRKVTTDTGAVTTLATGGRLASSPTDIEVDGEGNPWVALLLASGEKGIVKFDQSGSETVMLSGICCDYYGNGNFIGDAFLIDSARGFLYYSASRAPQEDASNQYQPYVWRIPLGSLPAAANAGTALAKHGPIVRGPVTDMAMNAAGQLHVVWNDAGKPGCCYTTALLRLEGSSFAQINEDFGNKPIGFAGSGSSLYDLCSSGSCDSLERRANGGAGTVTTIAGGSTPGSADGSPGSLNEPVGLAIAPDGSTAWIADRGNRKIRQVKIPPDPFELSAAEGCPECNPGQRRLTMPKVLDPVDVASGSLTESFTDLAVPGRGVPAAVTRTYNSLFHERPGLFGLGWSSPLDMSLEEASGTISVTQENGALLPFARMPDGSIMAPPRVTSELEELSGGGWKLTRNRTDVVLFDDEGRVSGWQDRHGYDTTVTRPSASQIVMTTPGGRSLVLSVNASDRVTSVSDDSSSVRTVTYSYNGDRLAGVSSFKVNATDASPVTWGYGYDGSGRLNRVTDPRGRSNLTHYDTQGRVDYQLDYSLSGTSGARSDIAYGGTWPAEHRIVTLPANNASGTRPKVRYDLSGLLTTSMTTGYGTSAARTTSYEYFPETLFLKEVKVAGVRQVSFTYDEHGNVLTSTDAAGRTSTFGSYDAFNNPHTVTDPAGNVAQYEFDPTFGYLTKSSIPVKSVGGASHGTAITDYLHEDPAHPEDVTKILLPDQQGSPTPKYLEFGYRASDGQLDWSEVPPNPPATQDNRTSYTYDSRGFVTSVTTPRGNATGTVGDFTTTFTVNDFGMVQTVTDPLDAVSSQLYDGNGNVVSVTDANGQLTTTEYDDMNRPRIVRRAVGTADEVQTETTYFPDGSVRDQINGLGAATRYTYDVHGAVASVTDPNLSVTGYRYDGLGRLQHRVDPGGACPATACTTYGYDAGNQLVTVAYTDPATPDITGVTYDALGQRTTVTRSAGGNQTWAWDNLGQLRSSTDVNGRTTSYGWTLGGSLDTITYPGPATVDYAYDAAGRMTSVTDWAGRTTTFAFDEDSNWKTTTFPAATANVDTRTYDEAGRLASVTWKQGATTLGALSYTPRDPEGQIVQEQTTSTGFSTRTWGYDDVDQLDQVGTAMLGVDDAGNLVVTEDGTRQVFDPAQQLCWTSPTASGACGTPAADATTFDYDTRGNRTAMARPDRTRADDGYDQDNRLISLRDGFEHPISDQPGTPLAGDFDGDGHHDVFWYSPGATPERVTWGDTRPRFGGTTDDYGVAGTYQAMTGDFDGDGNEDIFWYAPGSATDSVWFWFNAQSPNDYHGRAFTVNGTYRPVAGDFDADGYDDIYWYAPSTGADSIWWGNTNVDQSAAFTSQAVGRGGDSYPVSGDLDGNGADDIVWYTPGTAADDVYFSAGARNSWLSREVAIGGSYRLEAGDFDGDGMDDLLFNPTSGNGGSLWWGNSANSYATTAKKSLNLPAGSEDATGDFDGDGHHDLLIDNATGLDTAWWGTTRTDFGTAAAAIGLAHDNTIAASYSYDAGALRSAKTVEGTTTQFTWNTAAGLPLLLSQHQGTATTRIVYGPGGTPVYQDGPGGVAYYHQDHQGSTRLITSSTGIVAGRMTYDAYGAVENNTVPAALRPLLGYVGQYTDAETGYIYLRARYMDPRTGQFTTGDPLVAQTSEPYAYAGRNPVAFTDPTGLFIYGECLSGSFAFGGGSAVQGCYVNDGDAISIVGFAGGHLGSPSAGVEHGYLFSNAENASQLRGGTECIGGGGGTPVTVAVEVCRGLEDDGSYNGILTVYVAVGVGLVPGEAHITRGATGVTEIICFGDPVESVTGWLGDRAEDVGNLWPF